MNRRFIDATKGSIVKNILFILYPILICGLFQQVYTILNGIMVGKVLGSEALAAVGGSTTNLINMFVNVSNGVVTASMVVLSQDVGSGKRNECRNNFKTSLIIVFVIALFFNILYYFNCHNFLVLLKVPTDILEISTNYLKVYCFGFVSNMIVLMIINMLRGLGESQRPTILLIVLYLIYILFDFVYIVVLKLGVLGVALSYITTQSLMAIILLRMIHIDYEVFASNSKFEVSIFKRVMLIGIPASITSFLYQLTIATIQSAINSLGSTAVAGFVINNKIENLFWIVMASFGVSLTNVVAQNYGANKIDRVKKSIPAGLLVCSTITISLTTIVLLFVNQLVSMFTHDPAVASQAISIIRFIQPMLIFYVIVETYFAFINGLGKSFYSTIATFFGVVIVRFSWIILYASKTGNIKAIVFTYPLSWAATSLIYLIVYLIIKNKYLKEDKVLEENIVESV
ncbi:MAG: MATE family efflux transporter [Erysipelotrichia bacterium]|nr:MATE family efflux transporter [Erysipelotrichia bacterium]